MYALLTVDSILGILCRYLTGFTLFLSLILNRTFFLIVDLIKSEEKMEVIKKQVLLS